MDDQLIIHKDRTRQKSVASSDATHSRQRMVQNHLILWLDASLDQSSSDCQDKLTQLRTVVNDVHLFTQRDECIDFLTEVDDVQIFLLLEDTIAQRMIPLIHDISQLDTIYLLCRNTSAHEEWTKGWAKVKGVHTDITSICQTIKHGIKLLSQNSIALSFIGTAEGVSSENLNQLEPTFMYTQIFKEILLKMDYDEQSIKNFGAYCRKSNNGSSIIIDRFETEYQAESAIWWYTYPSFIYSILNCALRMMEADTIIHMGFLIRDLHGQIEELHRKQVSGYHGQPFTVYRGQGLSANDFEKLRKTKGGLMSFNNFLSTSDDRDISLDFAICASTATDTVGILFQMTIDSSLSSTPFAAIREVSHFKTEEEILFSMHTVFRIGEIKQLEDHNSLYQVELQLTSDDDPQLRTLTECIRKETPGSTGWERLGRVLLIIGQLNKAEELYNALLEQSSDQSEKALYYVCLGYAKNGQGDYEPAIMCYEKGLEIRQKTLPLNHPYFATSYHNIGEVYNNMGEYSKALSFYEKALEIRKNTLPPNHSSLATTYNNIGSVYDNMGEYSKALSFHEKALENRLKTLPSNHPDLATSYSNIGLVYKNLGEDSKALSFYEKALEILQRTLPQNHPDLATSYNNISFVYNSMREYSKALSFYEKALEIRQKTLPPDRPQFAFSYNSIGSVYDSMGEYSKALSFYEKALEIRQKTLSPNHPSLATSYNRIGRVYLNMGEYSKALSFYEKAPEILQKTLPPNHPDLATSYNNIGGTYMQMKQYSEALSYMQRALDIYQRSLPPNHPDIQNMRRGIEMVKQKM